MSSAARPDLYSTRGAESCTTGADKGPSRLIVTRNKKIT
jgi:hypothetical protein